VTSYDEIPLVCDAETLAGLLEISIRQLSRLRRANRLPIPALPSLTRAPRWSRADVIAFLETNQTVRVRRRAA
jgi:hypothetical protein